MRAWRKPPSAGNVFDMLRLQNTAKRIAVELRVMTRTRHRADVRDACNAVGAHQGDEFFYRQGRMPDREYSAFRPLRFLRRRLFAHDASPARLGRRVSSIGP